MEYEKASDFEAKAGEANFPPPIKPEVKGGAHIAFELVTKRGDEFCMITWPDGLPGHDDPPHCLRFPHGLIRFGETIMECATRLVDEQLGLRVLNARTVEIDSYVDEMNHWHIEPICLVEVEGEANLHREASELVTFTKEDIPNMTFWGEEEFRAFLADLGL